MYIKSPLNYIGGKTKLLPQILPLFPQEIDTFVDLFAGGCNVGINVQAKNIHFNDNLTYLIEMYKIFQETPLGFTLEYIERRIKSLNLSLYNQQAYLNLRDEYNTYKNPLDLFVLIAFSFNHQIRFNNNHKFNNPFGKDRSSYNEKMKRNLINFITKLQNGNFKFSQKNFDEFDFSYLTSQDLVYCDPPYLITTGSYNDGKRGFKGWGKKDEEALLNLLCSLDKKNIRFALSNVLEHKGKSNEILYNWLEKYNYNVYDLNFNYANSSYQTLDRNKNSSREVLVTNYKLSKKEEPKQYEIHW